MSEINLDVLGLEELKEQARILGISLKGGLSEETLRSKIREVLGGTSSDDEEPVVVLDQQVKSRVKIRIHEDENDKYPVFVGVNGKSYRIQRGVDVDVPAEVAEVLRNAVQSVTRNGETRQVPTYSFSVLG
jgi:hypothetical protein